MFDLENQHFIKILVAVYLLLGDIVYTSTEYPPLTKNKSP